MTLFQQRRPRRVRSAARRLRGRLKATGEVHEIRPGTIYLLNDHDRHVLRVEEDLRVICTFNPPVTGQEVHDEDGAYPLLTADGAERSS